MDTRWISGTTGNPSRNHRAKWLYSQEPAILPSDLFGVLSCRVLLSSPRSVCVLDISDIRFPSPPTTTPWYNPRSTLSPVQFAFHLLKMLPNVFEKACLMLGERDVGAAGMAGSTASGSLPFRVPL